MHSGLEGLFEDDDVRVRNKTGLEGEGEIGVGDVGAVRDAVFGEVVVERCFDTLTENSFGDGSVGGVQEAHLSETKHVALDERWGRREAEVVIVVGKRGSDLDVVGEIQWNTNTNRRKLGVVDVELSLTISTIFEIMKFGTSIFLWLRFLY